MVLWLILLQHSLLRRFDAIHLRLDLLQNLRFPLRFLIHFLDAKLLDQLVAARRKDETRFGFVDDVTEVVAGEDPPLDDQESKANSIPEQSGVFSWHSATFLTGVGSFCCADASYTEKLLKGENVRNFVELNESLLTWINQQYELIISKFSTRQPTN